MPLLLRGIPGGGGVVLLHEGTGRCIGQLRAVALSPFVGQRLAMFITRQRASDLTELTDLIEAGTLRPNLERTYSLEQAAAAIRHLEAGQVRGKVAIAP